MASLTTRFHVLLGVARLHGTGLVFHAILLDAAQVVPPDPEAHSVRSPLCLCLCCSCWWWWCLSCNALELIVVHMECDVCESCIKDAMLILW